MSIINYLDLHIPEVRIRRCYLRDGTHLEWCETQYLPDLKLIIVEQRAPVRRRYVFDRDWIVGIEEDLTDE